MVEITKATENLINRDFHSDRPNYKTLTDITEFSISVRKVYLLPIIDYFDEIISAWKVGINPNVKLVNIILDEYYETLMNGENPIIHSGWRVHYRWSEWTSTDFKEACLRKAVRQIIQYVKDFLEE